MGDEMIMSTLAAGPCRPVPTSYSGTRGPGIARRLAVLAITAALAGCRGEAAPEEAEVVRPVKVATVAAAPDGRTLSYSGVVRARVESNIGFRVGGKIVERAVNVGDRVKVGQLIARLDDTDLKLAENSARAAVASARTRRDVTRDNLERAKPLLAQQFISQASYDIRRNDFDSAVSALASAEAQLRQAANATGYATLGAEKAGIVTAVTAEPGQVVSAGQTVVTVAEAGETEIAIGVPEQDAGRLTVGHNARVTLWASSRTGTQGRIREIAGQADAASRTYAVRVSVADPPQAMRLGMTATVAIQIDGQGAAIVVPLTALTEADGAPVVFLVDAENNTVRRTPVAVSGTADEGVRVTSGLKPGDVVVTAGAQFLRDGMRVKLPGERTRAPTGKSG
ncbi:MAG: efflux RND transporter periplasmic adaptor subunit [Hyphomicrobiaceae bacterium]|nr:efflux RND transporter periplasmic adaptor subunit [Hyphomicrobiaceae bacterium]